MLPGHRAILYPRTEWELQIALAALQANGIHGVIENAGFGSLFPGAAIPLYNERHISVPEVLEADARQILAGQPSRSRFFRPRRSRIDRMRVVLELIFLGWFIPGSTRRLRPFRAVALAVLAALILLVAGSILAASTTYLSYRWKVLNAKRGVREATPNLSLQRTAALRASAAELMIR